MPDDEKEYPVWCAEPDCGIDNCSDCPFSPFNLRLKQIELEKKVDAYRTYQDNCSYTDGIKKELLEFRGDITHAMLKRKDIYEDISSLRDEFKNVQLKIHNVPSNFNLMNQIAELKEHIANWICIESSNKEVLRELLNCLEVREIIPHSTHYILSGRLKGKDGDTEDTTELQTDPEWEKVRQEYFTKELPDPKIDVMPFVEYECVEVKKADLELWTRLMNQVIVNYVDTIANFDEFIKSINKMEKYLKGDKKE